MRSRLFGMKSMENRSGTLNQFLDNDVVELDLRHDGLRPPGPHGTMHQIRGKHGGQVRRIHLERAEGTENTLF